MAPGTELDVLTGLGNGYDVSRSGEHPLLVGGGVGIPPLYGLAKRLTAQGKRCLLYTSVKREGGRCKPYRTVSEVTAERSC